MDPINQNPSQAPVHHTHKVLYLILAIFSLLAIGIFLMLKIYDFGEQEANDAVKVSFQTLKR